MPNGPSVYGIESTAKNVQGPDYRAIGEPIRIAPLDFSLFTQLGQLQVQRDNTAMQRERLGFEREALEYRKLNDQRDYEYKIFQEISKNGPSPYSYNPATQTVERGKDAASAGVLDGTEFQRKVAEIDAELRKGMSADNVRLFQDLKNQGQGGSFDFSTLLSNNDKYRQAIANNPVFARYNVLNTALTQLQDQINKTKVEEAKGGVVADHRAISELYSMAEEIAQLDPTNMTDAEVMKYVQRAKSVNVAISGEGFDTFMEKIPETIKNMYVEQKRFSAQKVGDVALLESRFAGPSEDEMVEAMKAAIMSDPMWSQYVTQMFGSNGQDLDANLETLVRSRVALYRKSAEAEEWNLTGDSVRPASTSHTRTSSATVQYQMQSNDPNDAKAYTYTVFGDKDLNGMRLANSLVDEYSMTGMDAAMVVQEADSYIKQMQEQFEVPTAAEALGITKDMSRDQIVKIIAAEKFKQSNPKYDGTGASRPYYEVKIPTNADLGIDNLFAEEIATVVDATVHDGMKAVMREESSGNPIAIWKDINGKISAGLFQFNGERLYNFLGQYIDNSDIPNKEALSKYITSKDGSYGLGKEYTEEELKNGQDVKDVQFVMAELLKRDPRAFVNAQQDYAYTQFVDKNLQLFNKKAGVKYAHKAPGFDLMLNSISVNTGPWGNEQIYTNWEKNRKADPFVDPEAALYELHLERIKYVKPHIIRQAKERGMDANDFWQRMERRYLRDYYNAAALIKGWKAGGGSMFQLDEEEYVRELETEANMPGPKQSGSTAQPAQTQTGTATESGGGVSVNEDVLFRPPAPRTDQQVGEDTSGALSPGAAGVSNEVVTPTVEEDETELNDLTDAVYSDEYSSTGVPQLLKQLSSEKTHMVTRPDGKEIRFRKNPNNNNEFFVYIAGENTQFLSGGELFELLQDVE